MEALLVPLHPGPARLGTDLLPAPHPEAGAEKRWGLVWWWYGDPGAEFPRGSEAQRIRTGLIKARHGVWQGLEVLYPQSRVLGTHITAWCGHSGLVG